MAGHKFDPAKAGRLDGWLRRRLLPAKTILADFKPESGETWVDIGAGTGFLTIPLAKRVAKVYALDLSEQMLALLKRRIESEGADNVEAMLSGESRLPLGDNTVDAALMVFVAHELDEPEQMFSEISRVVRPSGRLFIVEYTRSSTLGPPRNHRLDPEDVDRWAGEAGFSQPRSYSWSRSLPGLNIFDLAGWEYRT